MTHEDAIERYFNHRSGSSALSRKRYARAASKRLLDAPFVAIDSEGGSIDRPIVEDGKSYQPHKSFLWGAGDIDGRVDWLYTGLPLSGLEIIEWLDHVRKSNPKAIFISFSFGYDVGQLVADMPYEKAWELQHGKPYCDKDNTKKQSNTRRVVAWGGYGIQYLKGKQLTIYFGKPDDERRKRIRIYDVFGFFQSSFLYAIKSMSNVASATEYAIVEKGKSERGTFNHATLSETKEYTRLELTILCRMMDRLRQALAGQELVLSTWFGAGSIASSLLKRQEIKPHLGETWADGIPDAQTAAHHAFFGGRIELIKQGATSNPLWGYDIASAYPAIAATLSSMKGGKHVKMEQPSRICVENSDRLSLFLVRAEFKSDAPFYPLPYRLSTGAILFPRRTYGWYMQAELAAALDFADQFGGNIEIERGFIFKPATDEKPFAFLGQMFDYRKSLRKEDITQIVIKLGINSVYGKVAQAVGQHGEIPAYASPWHAAAITAGTRARLLLATLHNPEWIVMLATDGIVSEQQLQLAIPAEKTLGAWEESFLPQGGIFIQSGVYAFADEQGRWKAKSRGFRPSNVKGDVAGFLRETIPAQWAANAESFAFPYQNYMTLGASVASRETWAHIGQWVTATRDLDLKGCGVKRVVSSRRAERTRRSRALVATTPSYANETALDADGNLIISRAHEPKWLDSDFGFESLLETEQEAILAGFF